MSHIIEGYYAQVNVIPFVLEQKVKKFQRNEDISKEFEYWITHQKYKSNGVVVNGYSAKDLAQLSRFLDGEGAFMLLIELREEPEKAMKRIQQGFKLK